MRISLLKLLHGVVTLLAFILEALVKHLYVAASTKLWELLVEA